MGEKKEASANQYGYYYVLLRPSSRHANTDVAVCTRDWQEEEEEGQGQKAKIHLPQSMKAKSGDVCVCVCCSNVIITSSSRLPSACRVLIRVGMAPFESHLCVCLFLVAIRAREFVYTSLRRGRV